MYKIAAVSYFNTLPFLYGLEHYNGINKLVNIQIDYPSKIAQQLLNNEIDIALVPIVILRDNPDLKIITPRGIVADGVVASVKLFSNKPLKQIDKILLDYQSRTSVNLIRVLARFFWKIEPVWIQTKTDFHEQILNGRAAVVIGDRALQLLGQYKYEYDLAHEWKKFTNLPFVFAAWVSNKKIDNNFLSLFEQALDYGISNIEKVIEFYFDKTKVISQFFDPLKYLTDLIKYRLSKKEYASISKFFYFLEQL